MTPARSRLASRFVLFFCSAPLLCCSSCGEETSRYQVIPLEGKVEKIDAKPDGTGVISVLYRNEKRNQDVVGVGQVARETEIMINGTAAGLKDIRVGDALRGDVRIDRKGKEKSMVVLKIYVDRAVPVDQPGG